MKINEVKNISEHIKDLHTYINDDEIYDKYKKGIITNPNDFQIYCINHCLDIESLIKAYVALKSKYALVTGTSKKYKKGDK